MSSQGSVQSVGSIETRRHVSHAARRWAGLVALATAEPEDPRTITIWAHCAGVSPSHLRTLCKLAGVTGKQSLDFARLLRAVLHEPTADWQVQQHLDVADPRTLKALLSRAGLVDRSVPGTVHEFVVRQQLITNRLLVDEVHALFADSANNS